MIALKDQIEFIKKQIKKQQYSDYDIDNMVKQTGGTCLPIPYKNEKKGKMYESILKTLQSIENK